MYKEISANKRKSIALIVLFIAFIAGLGFVFGELSDAGPAGVIMAFLLAITLSSVSYFSGDKIALWSAGARKIEKTQLPYVYRMVENLCITAGMPVPAIYIINDPSMNAFATGRDPQHASIALTTGIVQGLENEELEGVIAHELAHIQNYDTRLMLIVIVLIGMVSLLSDWMLRSFIWRRSDHERSPLGPVLIIIGIILAILSPIIAQLIRFAISRKREFLADASGALLTRYPEGLANALKKIGTQPNRLRTANQATSHLYFSNPFETMGKKFSSLFSTHPPIEERISALNKMNV